MKLYICEKPSQGRDLANEISATQRADGCIHTRGGDEVITWAYGHLVEQYMPDDYDERLKQWSLETLPIIPESWQQKPRPSAKKQLSIVKKLIQKASAVVIATDYEREGEMIARELLDLCRYHGPVHRVPLRSLDPESIRRAINSTMDGSKTLPLYHAGLSRSRADWLIGMNLSRFYSVIATQAGVRETFHVGRVITPTVGLVVERDREIANFKPTPYFDIDITADVASGSFQARWTPPDAVADEQGRCTSRQDAQRVQSEVANQVGEICHFETKAKSEKPPLPFHLTSLQQYAANRWGYTAQQVLDGAQSLYENHKATSYPRTDSRYIPLSQRGDVERVLHNLANSDERIANIAQAADPSRSSRAFNDDKVGAHHAIIPTLSKCDVTALSDLEYNLYDAIRRHYIAQFYPDHEYDKSDVVLEVCGHRFEASGRIETAQGWTLVVSGDTDETEQSAPMLPSMSAGERASITDATLDAKKTKAPKHFTEATLLSAMENIARYVDDPRFKKVLRDSAGLGTEATRAATLEGAIKKGYLYRDKKKLRSTKKAGLLIDMVPSVISSPGMTAAWEQELSRIEAGEIPMQEFSKNIEQWVETLTSKLKDSADTLLQSDAGKQLGSLAKKSEQCFNCGSPLRRRKGKYGIFWSCSSQDCNSTFEDKNGKPAKPTPQPDNAPACPECGNEMRYRKSKKASSKSKSAGFWGCSQYPDCKGIVSAD